ncbi:MAG: phosphoadenosine phosphosulfate reductase family protein [Oscillospiraceae bacterium]|jgi:phosphoadenosine phosphosulfate reductase|nr:phosphoadenosine phosphosulfate reductase family protein [Oscillospiraceae bacterium]
MRVRSIARIRQAAEIAEQMGTRLTLAYSGGKDSDVILRLTRQAGVPFDVMHNHTTCDAPDTVRHVDTAFDALTVSGIRCEVRKPAIMKCADGKNRRASMWLLIERAGMPPLRKQRYCCRELKEQQNSDGQHLLFGVRWVESTARKARGVHESLDTKKARVVFADDNDPAHKITDICHMRSTIATNPIIDWSNADVYSFIRDERIRINPLYGLGFKRVGCIGCPRNFA